MTELDIDVSRKIDLHENAGKNFVTATFGLPGLAKGNVLVSTSRESPV